MFTCGLFLCLYATFFVYILTHDKSIGVKLVNGKSIPATGKIQFIQICVFLKID